MSLSICDIISNYKRNINFNKNIIYNVSIFCKHNKFIYMDNFLLNIDYISLQNIDNYILDSLLIDKIRNLLKNNNYYLKITNNNFINNNYCILKNKK